MKLWLESTSRDPSNFPVLLSEAYRILEETDSPHVIAVTQFLPSHRRLARARLANGDALACSAEFSGGSWFPPAANDRGMDAVLSRAIHHHKSELIEKCAETLDRTNLSEVEIRGALVLAGFIGDKTLAEPARAAWDRAENRSSILVPALWAGLRCAVSDPASILDELMAAWAALPVDEMGGGLSPSAAVGEELRFAIRRGLPEQILRYMIAKAKEDDAIRRQIAWTLQHLDHPLVVTFLVEVAAGIDRRIKGKEIVPFFRMALKDNWDPAGEMAGKRLPPDSVRAIRSCWEADAGDSQLRETAFQLWVSAVDDLDELRSISADHPQFETVLWRRAGLGDLSAIPLIRPLAEADQRWFQVIGNIWSDHFMEALDHSLATLERQTPKDCSGGVSNEHYMLAHLLRDIPVSDAQPIILRHWDYLRFSRKFVQLALYIGSPACLSLAADAIDDYPHSADPFQHIGHFFGFNGRGLMDRLELRHLKILRPYLERLDDHILCDMAEFCERRDLCNWSRMHLKPVFDRRRAELPQVPKEKREFVERLGRIHFPSDADLMQELDWIEKESDLSHWLLRRWNEQFDRRQDTRVRWQRVLEIWLAQDPSVDRFRIYSAAVLERGTREDIGLLSKQEISGNPDEVERLRANARTGIMLRSIR